MPKEDKHFWDETRKPWMDLEGEQRAVKPKKQSRSSKATEYTGVANQMMAGFFQDLVMEEAVKDFEDSHVQKLQPFENDEKVDFSAHAECEVEAKFEDDDLESIRLRRLAELKSQSSQAGALKAKGHGEYRSIDEPEFLPCVTSSAKVIVHFFVQDFRRCITMDKHLEIMAKSIMNCRFVKLDASKAAFFVSKLSVRVLPTIVFFHDGVAVGRMVGFDGVKDGDSCSTTDLVDALRDCKFFSEEDCKQFDATATACEVVCADDVDDDINFSD